jgi:alpha-L-fucosidase 2
MNNAFGYTAPGWDVPWGFFPAGAAWLAQHAWEHYEFGLDSTYLKETAYPIMKEAALFWMDYLSRDENGKLVSSPSYSPEHGGISGGASMDHQIAWDVLNNSAKAALVLGDTEFAKEAQNIRDNILLPQIGSWGQLQEWKEDVDDSTSRHRHISHLFALHPGRQISPLKTPELAEAARVTLEARGDDATGWSLGWKVNFWARLKDGDRAYKLYRMIMKPSGAGGSGSGSYPNLLDAHPPFQLDGNMGATAGVAEMLLQSQTGDIEFLPALPHQWASGKVKGLRARGGYTVDMDWKNGELKTALIKSDQTKKVTLIYQGKTIQKELLSGQVLKLSAKDWL